ELGHLKAGRDAQAKRLLGDRPIQARKKQDRAEQPSSVPHRTLAQASDYRSGHSRGITMAGSDVIKLRSTASGSVSGLNCLTDTSPITTMHLPLHIRLNRGRGMFGAYSRSAGLVHGTASSASMTRKVLEVPPRKFAGRRGPCGM